MNNNNIDKKFSEFTEVTSVDENAMIPLIQGVPYYNGIIPAYKFIESLGLDAMLDGLKELYLSKVEDDTANGKITFNKGIDVNDTLNAKDINAEFIVIEDDGTDNDAIIQGVTEFIELTEEEEAYITQILTEDTSGSGNLGETQLTLGGLLNADESFDGVEDGIYGFRKSGGIYYPILIQGEGGVPKILFRIKTITPSNLTVLDEDLSNIEYLWGSVDAIDGTETGVGELKVIVDDKVVHTGVVDQQSNAIDVTEHISLGSNNVKISVTDSYENTGTLNYQVSLVSSRFNFVDPEVERLLVIEFDNNNDGYLSIAEVNSIVSLYNSLKGSTIITEFNELKDFKNFKVLNSNAFSGCVNLSSVKLPSGLTKIEDGAFNNTPLLETIDLSNLDVLTSVNLLNSNFKQVGLNDNIDYDKLFLPNTLVNLKLKNQSLLTNSTFKMGGYSNLESIWVENTPGVDGLKLVTDVLNVEDSKLTNVRLIGIDVNNKLDELLAISKLRGMNANGVDCPIGEAVTGDAYFDFIKESDYYYILNKYPLLNITYDELFDDSNIPDGYVLATDDDFTSYNYGGVYNSGPIYVGGSEYVILPKSIWGGAVTMTSRKSDGNFYNAMFGRYMGYKEGYNGVYTWGTPVRGVATQLGHSITSMRWMFGYAKSPSLDLSFLNTNNVTDMSQMFYECEATEIDFSNVTCSDVTNMNEMFKECKVTSLDLSSFETSNLKYVSDMFYGCEATTIKLSSFNTSNVTNMNNMFRNSKPTSLNLSSFDTSNVNSMIRMFYKCKATTIEGLTSFDTSNVTTMERMFKHCRATELDLSSFDTSKVTNMTRMFWGSQANILDLSNFDISKVPTSKMEAMFWGCKATIGYARTQADADRFNATEYLPSGLTFVVKE